MSKAQNVEVLWQLVSLVEIAFLLTASTNPVLSRPSLPHVRTLKYTYTRAHIHTQMHVHAHKCLMLQDICVYCNPGKFRKRLIFVLFVNAWNLWKLERFCIPFYGIFKTESLSDRVRVRPAALRRLLSTKTVLQFVGRFGGFVWRFRGSGRTIVLSRSRWISSLLIFWPCTKTEIWTKKNFFSVFSHAEWKTLQLVSLPPFQFAWISWMKRPVFDVFDCSFVPDCFLLQFSLFLCCSIRRSHADFLERPAKRSECTVTNSRATSSRAGCPRRKTPTPFALACRKRSRISLSLSRLNRSCFPLVAMLQNGLGTRTKTSQTRPFLCCRSLSTTVPVCDLSENDRQNFAQIPFRSTVWATVSESIFGTRTQTSTFRPKNSVERNAKPPYYWLTNEYSRIKVYCETLQVMKINSLWNAKIVNLLNLLAY